jgi:CDP-6-deoxy-D-xylo-4-hexulose-3-dehydrase
MDKLANFIDKRRVNRYIIDDSITDIPWLKLQNQTPQSKPSWFAALIILDETAPLIRDEVVEKFERMGIQTRPFFAGNLTRQPAYLTQTFKIHGELINTNYLMENAFFIGVWPGYTAEQLYYICDAIEGLKNA